MSEVCIIVPAYNEENRIKAMLKAYCDFLIMKEVDFRILVILNNCHDNTLLVIKNLKKTYNEIEYLDFEEGGKGFAILKGFENAIENKDALIGFVDADMATPPEAFYDLIKNIGNSDGAIASRWKKGATQNYSLKRKIMSKGFNFIVRSVLILPYSDTQCGAKLFKKSVIEKVANHIQATRWAFDVDLLFNIKKRNFKINEVATKWKDKAGSKMSFIKVPFQMFSSIMRVRLVYSPFNFIVRLYDKIPEKRKINNW